MTGHDADEPIIDRIESAEVTGAGGLLREPRRRLTVEALGLILIAVLVGGALVFVFILARNTDDGEVAAAGVETLSSLAAVLAGAMAGYLGRGAIRT